MRQVARIESATVVAVKDQPLRRPTCESDKACREPGVSLSRRFALRRSRDERFAAEKLRRVRTQVADRIVGCLVRAQRRGASDACRAGGRCTDSGSNDHATNYFHTSLLALGP